MDNKFMRCQHGFFDSALLLIAKKARWFIRYPVAICVLYAAWWMIKQQLIFLPLVFLACAVVLTKEVSTSILLIVAAIWIWPNDFFDIPFAQMTFGILSQFFLSAVLFISSPIAGLLIYTKLEYIKYANEISKNPS